MKISFADLWRPSGTVDRGTYALVGVLGFALKHNVDRLIASVVFHRHWGVFNYWVPLHQVMHISNVPRNEAAFLATMVAVALPFVWAGVMMTMKRLRSARLPAWLIVLFFIPFLNLAFFLLLSLWPEHVEHSDLSARSPQDSAVNRIIPKSRVGSAAVSLLITVPIGLGMAMLGVRTLTYGWGLFVAVPFAMGFAAALIYGMREPRDKSSCIGVACLSVMLLAACLFAFAIEGAFCLAMAVPLALPLAVFGGYCGYGVQRRRWLNNGAPAFLSLLLIFVPGVQWADRVFVPPRVVFAVRTAIDVKAPPEKVWREVVAFTEIPPPTEWMFRAGIAYPIRAQMIGSGPGAERHCVFSTGAFVEPIEIWDEPHRLKFSVISNPPPMEEWTPYSHIDPPHLHGFLESNGGQFLLTPLPDGGTRLEGTTWYRHGLWPATYWRWWSDAIIHRIHLRVLNHIRSEAER